MKRVILTALILLLGASYCSAKRKIDKRKRKKRYTLQDSLRGGLSQERTCYDVHFYDLTIDFNLKDSSITGVNDIAFNVLNPTSRIQLDLFENMHIDSVVYLNDTLAYTRVGNAFFVDFPRGLQKGRSASLKVFYHGKPVAAKNAPWDGGFVWSNDEKERPFVGVACEGLGASSWWPNKDHLSDKPDSMVMNFIVPKGLDCVANGVKMFSKPHVQNESKTHFQWKVHYPIINYNVTFYLGHFETLTDYYISDEDSLLLRYHVLDYNVEKATAHFEQVKPMLKIYEELFGKYPFWKDGYKLVDAPYLGMEHQSAIAYGNDYKKGYKGRQMIGVEFDYVIIHESGHEYWGNNISMKDLADMWIHEAFCTYSEALYVEKRYGYDIMVDYLNNGGKSILNDKPMIPKYHLNQKGSGDMYLKGALMLHLVRDQLDDDLLWFATLKDMHVDFAYQSVSTPEVLLYLKSKLGKKVMPIFEQYLRVAALPKLVVQKVNGKGNYIIRWSGAADFFDVKVNFQTKTGPVMLEVNSSPNKFNLGKVKDDEPEVLNSFGLFDVYYK